EITGTYTDINPVSKPLASMFAFTKGTTDPGKLFPEMFAPTLVFDVKTFPAVEVGPDLVFGGGFASFDFDGPGTIVDSDKPESRVVVTVNVKLTSPSPPGFDFGALTNSVMTYQIDNMLIDVLAPSSSEGAGAVKFGGFRWPVNPQEPVVATFRIVPRTQEV